MKHLRLRIPSNPGAWEPAGAVDRTLRVALRRVHIERKAMKANVGTIDRVVRLAAGLVLIALAVTGTVGPWAYVGVVPLLTGLFRVCPLYSVLGWSTCPLSERR
jgi:hypothetical protein